MNTENVICQRYEAELAAIAALDRCYYLAACPGRSERAAYAIRQAQLENTRTRFYAELTALKQVGQFRHCRSVIRQPRSLHGADEPTTFRSVWGP